MSRGSACAQDLPGEIFRRAAFGHVSGESDGDLTRPVTEVGVGRRSHSVVWMAADNLVRVDLKPSSPGAPRASMGCLLKLIPVVGNGVDPTFKARGRLLTMFVADLSADCGNG